MPWSKRPLTKAVLVLAALLAAAGPTRAVSGDEEFRLKAAFVLNFLKFAEWPANALGKADGTLVLAVIGDGPAASAIEADIDGKTIQGRRVAVHRHPDLASWKRDPDRCHALFVTPEAWPDWTELRATITNRPVLTIAESPGFCEAGGTLNLYEDENRIRFEANPSAASKSGVMLRAELLKLAKIVKTEGERR